MAAPSKSIVDGVLKMALEIVEPTIQECSQDERREIHEHMRNCAEKEATLTNFLADFSKLPDGKMQEKLRKHLSDEDYKKISEYVDEETFTMTITGSRATFERGSKKFLDPIQLTSMEGIAYASTLQIASIVIESIFLVLGVIGVKITLKETLIRKIIQEIIPVVEQPAFRRIIDEFLQSWTTGNTWGKAKAIFTLLKETYSFGIFWKVIKIALSEMSWLDRIKTIALIAATIVAAFATDGIALIAKITLSVNDAYNLGKKVINMTTLKALAADVKK